MILSPYKISENFLLKKLKSIRNGSLTLNNYDCKFYNFGDETNNLKANIKIHNQSFILI